MGKKKGKHINKTIKKLSNFFNESETFSAVTFIGMYDINTKHFLTAFKYYLKTGINTLDEYSDLQYISWDINGKEEIYYDEERRNRIYQYLNKENYWNIYDVLDNKKLALLKSILIESKNRDSYKQSYKVRRKQASIYTANLKLRKKIFKRDGAFCRICGSKENIHYHHHLLTFLVSNMNHFSFLFHALVI